MNRREFTTLSSLSAAALALRLPAASAQSPGRKIGFAVVGLGVIAKEFMQQIAGSETAEVVAFVTGDAAKGHQWAQQYNVPDARIYSYDTMTAGMRANPAIQAVYIATPNGLHMRDTLASAAAGKHVLCEKPMANTPEECRRMIAACKAASVHLMIAYRMQYEPLYFKAKQMIASGALGRIAVVEGAFGFDSKPNVWRLTRKLAGGGPLVDVGIYPLNAIRFLTGEDPRSYTAAVATTDTTSGRFSEVEESMVWTMKMPSGALAACATSYGANVPGTLRIQGEKGTFEFQGAYNNGGIHLIGTGDAKLDETSPKEPVQLRLEAEHLAECVRNNTAPRSPGEEGLKDHIAMAEIYKAAGVRI